MLVRSRQGAPLGSPRWRGRVRNTRRRRWRRRADSTGRFRAIRTTSMWSMTEGRRASTTGRPDAVSTRSGSASASRVATSCMCRCIPTTPKRSRRCFCRKPLREVFFSMDYHSNLGYKKSYSSPAAGYERSSKSIGQLPAAASFLSHEDSIVGAIAHVARRSMNAMRTASIRVLRVGQRPESRAKSSGTAAGRRSLDRPVRAATCTTTRREA